MLFAFSQRRFCVTRTSGPGRPSVGLFLLALPRLAVFPSRRQRHHYTYTGRQSCSVIWADSGSPISLLGPSLDLCSQSVCVLRQRLERIEPHAGWALMNSKHDLYPRLASSVCELSRYSADSFPIAYAAGRLMSLFCILPAACRGFAATCVRHS